MIKGITDTDENTIRSSQLINTISNILDVSDFVHDQEMSSLNGWEINLLSRYHNPP